jgi:hypothetical protein
VVNPDKGFVLDGEKGNFNVHLESNFRWLYLLPYILFFMSSPSDILFRDCVARFLFSFVFFSSPRICAALFRLKRKTYQDTIL